MRLSIILGLGVMIVSFQNCFKASFGSAEGSLSKADAVLVPVDTDPDSADAQDPSTPVVEDHGKKHDRECDHDQVKDRDEEVVDREDRDDEDAAGDLVACILDGPGKSIKLGIMSNQLSGVNSVAKSVCVTENACLNLVPAKFTVKGVEDRGYCKNNRNVVRLTDAEIKALLGI